MAHFDVEFDKIINTEGGYIFDPLDPGGETKYGISKRSYPNIDIKNITQIEAKLIYEADFWNSARLTELDNQAIAAEVFDSLVNIGPKVKKWLQESYNLTNYWDGNYNLSVDGIIGSKTIAAINSSRYPKRILKTLNGFQFYHYVVITRKNPKLKKWFGGWLTRVWEN